jgi:hypothetical protein
VNEPIAVEARFKLDGTVQPLAFLWQESAGETMGRGPGAAFLGDDT